MLYTLGASVWHKVEPVSSLCVEDMILTVLTFLSGPSDSFYLYPEEKGLKQVNIKNDGVKDSTEPT